MRRPVQSRRSPVADLLAFFMVLATGILLVALGLSPESLAAVTIALATLYSAWRAGRPSSAPPSQGPALQNETDSVVSSPVEGDDLLADDLTARRSVE